MSWMAIPLIILEFLLIALPIVLCIIGILKHSNRIIKIALIYVACIVLLVVISFFMSGFGNG